MTVPRAARRRDGFALVVVIFALMALALLAAGLVFISTEESAIARSIEERFRARLAAESAIRVELLHWDSDRHRASERGAIGELRTNDDGEPVLAAAGHTITRTTVERIAGPLFLIRAHSISRMTAEANAAAVIGIIDPRDLWLDFPAALATSGPAHLWSDDALTGFSAATTPTPEGEDCHGAASRELEVVFGSTERPPVYRIPPGTERGLWLGPIPGTELERLADHSITGLATPYRTDPPATAGQEMIPLLFSPGDLHIVDLDIHAILVVDGDLTLTGNAVVSGVVLVAGALRLHDRARIAGAATIVGGYAASLEQASRIDYDPCAIYSALTRARLTGRAFHPHDRGWLPAF